MKEIEFLLNNGFKIFKLEPNSVVPLRGSRGFYDAKDNWSLQDLDEQNLGIRCGREGNNLIVLDVEARNNGLENLKKWEKEFGKLPDTVTAKTKRGGLHFYFTGDAIARNCSERLGADLKSGGGYVVLPPSKTPLGAYEWVKPPEQFHIAPIPQWVLDLFDADPKKQKTFVDDYVPETEHDDSDVSEVTARFYLDYVDFDSGYDAWLRVGMALHSLKTYWAFELWDEWSAKGEKYKAGECFKKWQTFDNKSQNKVTFGTIVHLAKEAMEEDFKQISKMFLFSKNPVKVETKEFPFPEPQHGLLKDIYFELLNNACFIPQKSFALATAISILSGIMQKTVKIPAASKLVFYNILIGHPSCGKNDYLSAATSILGQVEPRLLANEVRSDQALKKMLNEFPCRVMIKDEILGSVERAFSKKNNDSITSAIFELYLRLWSRLEVLEGSVTKNKEMCIEETFEPRFSIVGASNPNMLETILENKAVIDSGYLSRFDLWFEDKNAMPNSVSFRNLSFSKELIDKLKNLWKLLCQKSKDKEPLEVSFTKEVEVEFLKRQNDIFTKYKSDDPNASIFRRSNEKALRIASLHAAGRGNAEIALDDWCFAVSVCNFQIKSWAEYFEQDLITTEYNEIIEKIINFLKKNNSVTVSLMVNRIRSLQKFKDHDVYTILRTAALRNSRMSLICADKKIIRVEYLQT